MTEQSWPASGAVPHPRALSADEWNAWLGLLGILELLPAVLDSEVRRVADLTHFDYRVLATLAEATEHRLRMTDLADRTNATLTRLSHGVRRLEGRGLVERSRSREDGRVTDVRLSSAGLDVVVDMGPRHVDTVRRHVIDVLTPSQVRELRHIADALRSRLGRPLLV